MEELASVNALYAEAKADLEQATRDAGELEELRELRADVERKERQQAMIIESQARGGADADAAAAAACVDSAARLARSFRRRFPLCLLSPPLPCACAAPSHHPLTHQHHPPSNTN